MYQEFNGDITEYSVFGNRLRILSPSKSSTDEFDNTTIKFSNVEQVDHLINVLSLLKSTYTLKKQAEIDIRQTIINFE